MTEVVVYCPCCGEINTVADDVFRGIYREFIIRDGIRIICKHCNCIYEIIIKEINDE